MRAKIVIRDLNPESNPNLNFQFSGQPTGWRIHEPVGWSPDLFQAWGLQLTNRLVRLTNRLVGTLNRLVDFMNRLVGLLIDAACEPLPMNRLVSPTNRLVTLWTGWWALPTDRLVSWSLAPFPCMMNRLEVEWTGWRSFEPVGPVGHDGEPTGW